MERTKKIKILSISLATIFTLMNIGQSPLRSNPYVISDTTIDFKPKKNDDKLKLKKR